MHFCYSFGRLGKGPHEYIAPRFVQGVHGNHLSIYDSAYDRIDEFIISDKEKELVSEKKIQAFYFPVQGISYVNEKTILMLLQTDEDVKLYSYNAELNSIVDTLFFETDFKKQLKHDYNSTLDFFSFSNYGNKIVITFNFINKVIVTYVDDNGIFKKNNASDFPAVTVNKTLYNNVVYYLFPVTTSSLIYTQYYGKRFKYMQPFPLNTEGRSMDFLVEVYDWDQNPKRLLHLDSDILRFYVNEKTQKLYAWHASKDFDYLLEYDLN